MKLFYTMLFTMAMLFNSTLAARAIRLHEHNNLNQIVNHRLVGNDRDAYGCLVSAGYSWCNHTLRCESVNYLCSPVVVGYTPYTMSLPLPPPPSPPPQSEARFFL